MEINVVNYGTAKRNPLAQTRKRLMSHEQAIARGTKTNLLVG